MSDEKTMGDVIQIDEARIRDHLGELVRGTVEETLNAMLDAEACQIASNRDPRLAGKNDPSGVAETGGAEPQIAEQSRSWRAAIGEWGIMRGS
jgi:hypothetical protein